jgi:PAS domain S-box-containing protein
VASGTTPVETETFSVFKKVWVRQTIHPSASGVTVYFRDVTERRKAADTLRESEERYRSLFEHSMDGVLLTRPTGEVLAANPAACRMFQRTAEEICRLGRPGLVDLEDPRLPVLLEERRRTGRTRSELTLIRRDGSKFPAEIASVTFDDRNGLQQTSMLIRDLTGQKRADRAQTLLAELGAVLKPIEGESTLQAAAPVIARHLGDLVVFLVAQQDGELRRFTAAARQSGQSWLASELSKPSSVALRPDHPASEVFRARQARIMQLAPESLESIAETPEHLRAIRAAAVTSVLLVPLMAGESCLGVMGLGSASEAFEEADLPVALEIGRRCALFMQSAALYRSERQATLARDELLGIVAHDLRNPLESILLQAQLLRRPGGDPERRSTKPVAAIERAGKRMTGIIQDLLEVTRMEAGHLELERARISTGDFLAEVVEAQRPHLAARSLSLTVEEGPAVADVWADRSRLFQVFENLLGNAVKFTERGGISVGAKLETGEAGKAGNEVVFWVADTGVGLAKDDVPHVFDRFWQARKAQNGGAGLGLAIVSGIVQAHSGRLWVESELGRGSTFYFSLPAAPERPRTTGACDWTSPAPTGG